MLFVFPERSGLLFPCLFEFGCFCVRLFSGSMFYVSALPVSPLFVGGVLFLLGLFGSCQQAFFLMLFIGTGKAGTETSMPLH